MSCRRVQNRLSLAGESSQPWLSDMEHAAKCAHCSEYLRKDAEMKRILASQPAIVPPPDFEERLLRRIHRSLEERQSVVPAQWFFGATPWRWAAAAALVVLVAGLGREGYRQRNHTAGHDTATPVTVAAEARSRPVETASTLLPEARLDAGDPPFHYMASPENPPTVVARRLPRQMRQNSSIEPQLIRFDP